MPTIPTPGQEADMHERAERLCFVVQKGNDGLYTVQGGGQTSGSATYNQVMLLLLSAEVGSTPHDIDETLAYLVAVVAEHRERSRTEYSPHHCYLKFGDTFCLGCGLI